MFIKNPVCFVGQWVQRSSVHVDEFYRFCSGEGAFPWLNAAKLTQLRKEMHIGEIARLMDSDMGGISVVVGSYELFLSEDGVLMLSSDSALEKEKLMEWFDSRIVPAFSYLFSAGAPLPQFLAEKREPYPVVEFVSSSLLKRKKIKYEQDGSTVRFWGVTDAVSRQWIAQMLIFFSEQQRWLSEYMIAHRTYWDEVSEIRGRKTLRVGDLPGIHRNLLNLGKDTGYILSRLGQAGVTIDRRRRAVEEHKDVFRGFGLQRFDRLQSDLEYMRHLWEMTDKFVRDTIMVVEQIYQENSQEEMSVLQAIFLTGTIASIIALGAMPASFMRQYTPSGEFIGYVEVSHFSFNDMFTFGLFALGVALAIFVLIHLIVSRLKKLRSTHFLHTK